MCARESVTELESVREYVCKRERDRVRESEKESVRESEREREREKECVRESERESNRERKQIVLFCQRDIFILKVKPILNITKLLLHFS